MTGTGQMTHDHWTVGLIDDASSYCEIVREVLSEEGQVEQVLSWQSAEEYWRDTDHDNLDILYVDYRLPHMDGIELIAHIHKEKPDLPLVMLTAAASDEVIFRALRAGAVGFILKAELDDLPRTTLQILRGGAVISPSIAAKVLTAFRKPLPADHGLTTRERQVLKEIVAGASYAATSDLLGISQGTIKVHIRNIYKKLNIKNQIELTRKAYELGLGPDS